MPISALLNQTVTHYPAASKDKYGKFSDSAGTAMQARFQYVTESKALPNGQLVTIDAVVYVSGDASVDIDDRIDYGDELYRVSGKSAGVDINGHTHHYKVFLKKQVS